MWDRTVESGTPEFVEAAAPLSHHADVDWEVFAEFIASAASSFCTPQYALAAAATYQLSAARESETALEVNAVSDLVECPECGATDFLQIQHGYVYWSATMDPDGCVNTELEPHDFGDVDTVGYECAMCDATFDCVEDIVS
jgi:hypothetical protein